MRRDWPVLRLGQVKLILTSGDCLAMTRWLEQTNGPRQILMVMNRSGTVQTVELPGRKIELAPYGWLLEADGQPIVPNEDQPIVPTGIQPDVPVQGQSA
jgi:hypothetical protein